MPVKLKEYSVACSTNEEFAECPARATFQIDESFAREIIDLSYVVQQHDLVNLRKWRYCATYLRVDPDELSDIEEEVESEEPQEMRTETNMLVVSDHYFWFSCHLKHQSALISTDDQSISELAEFFGLEFSPSRSGAGETSPAVGTSAPSQVYSGPSF